MSVTLWFRNCLAGIESFARARGVLRKRSDSGISGWHRRVKEKTSLPHRQSKLESHNIIAHARLGGGRCTARLWIARRTSDKDVIEGNQYDASGWI